MQRSNKQKKSGLTRADAARDAMRSYGFDELVNEESIKALLEIYGQNGLVLIEEGRYDVLLTHCLEKQQKKENVNAVKLSADFSVFPDHGMKSSHNGDTEETDPDVEEDDEDEDDDDDDEMIILAPEPLCQELEELFSEEPVLVLENNSEPRRSTREKKPNPKYL